MRLFKRFFYSTVLQKYGYMKNVQDKVEISGRMLCAELELNPKVLPLSGVITVFSEDAMLSWLAFLKIMCLFLLQKDVLEYRLEFLLRFLKLTRPEDLERADYMQDKLQKFQFAKRGIVVSDVPTLLFWNRVRAALSKQNAYIFEQTGPARGTAAVLNMSRAIGVLIDSGIEASDTVCFFDSLFDIS